MKELFSHLFILVAVVFFIGVIGAITVLLSWSSETKTIDTSAGQIIQKISTDVGTILDISHNAPDE